MVGTRFAKKLQVGTATKTTLGGFVGILCALGIASQTGWFVSTTTNIGLVAQCSSGSCATLVTEVVECTATGGLAGYAHCNWQEPTNDYGSGSIIRRIDYEVGLGPASPGVDITAGASATTSGSTVLVNNITSGTGAVGNYTTGTHVLNSGDYIRAVTLTDPTSTHTARMIIEYRPKIPES
tara:strand:+ start:6829 stop:7371 length:543 start_codon:yes stop_codon:yes gene_type:complete